MALSNVRTIKKLESNLNDLLTQDEDILSNEDKLKIDEIAAKIDSLREGLLVDLKTWDRVTIARNAKRPKAQFYIDHIFEEFLEFHGDRGYKDDHSIVGGIAMFNGIPVTVIGQNKGENTEENIDRNFGMPNPEGYRKALRLMQQADKFNRPIITFIDTPGAYPGIGAEERGQGQAIAQNLAEMSQFRVPVLSIVIGEGGSGGALALGVCNELAMLENSIYSILSPEGYATILWKDAKRAKEAADIMKLTAQDLNELKICDQIIPEPLGGAHELPNVAAENIKEIIEEFLEKYSTKTSTQIRDGRYRKFRKIGEFQRFKYNQKS